ncbi:MAG: type II secretion system secretin GspD [Bryobacterales bacterium]|nr:type II secretion system secretin GspD [Bryobacterales bacterium]
MQRVVASFLAYVVFVQPIAWSQNQAQQQPAAGAAAPAQTASPPPKVSTGNLNLANASLTEVIDALCRTLRINYIIDPRVKGAVTLNTYGETRQIDARNLLDLVLRINGATMVQVGEFFRIVPLTDVSRMPLPPNVTSDPKAIPEDDQTILNLVFLKYATVAEVSKLIEPFIGEGARTMLYAPANLLFLLDSRRNIRRTMEIISLFDSDSLASQRVRLFEVKNGSPTSIAKEVDEIMKSISMSDKASVVRFLPIDRINTIIAIAPNPGAFEEVEKWIRKLDTEVKVTAGTVDNFVYRVKYSRAEILAAVIMSLYGGYGYMGMMGMMGGMGGMGMGGMGMGGMGMGGYGMGGMGMGGMGMGGYGMGGMGMGGYGMGGYGMGGYGMGGYGNANYAMGLGMNGPMMQMGQSYPGAGTAGFVGPGMYAPQYPTTGGGTGAGVTTPGGAVDQTGQYLAGPGAMGRIPRVIPNPIDNTLMIQATAQEYQQIMKLLREVDIPPRQVLIDARIYEVALTGAFASGVSAFLQRRSTGGSANPGRQLLGQLSEGAVNLSAGMLVGSSRELLGFLQLAENQTRARVVSAPSVIATDSIAASINVGLEVPTLASQAVTGVQQGGNSLFANTIQSRSTGVTLNIMARVNPSGIVTMIINQDVSSPQAPSAGSIQSPSFSRRSVNTQVTVQDGDTIAIGGIINETNSMSTNGVPGLNRIPVVGSVFGSRSYSKERTELIIFMTPRVIYDTNQIVDASDEIRSRLKELNKYVKQ